MRLDKGYIIHGITTCGEPVRGDILYIINGRYIVRWTFLDFVINNNSYTKRGLMSTLREMEHDIQIT